MKEKSAMPWKHDDGGYKESIQLSSLMRPRWLSEIDARSYLFDRKRYLILDHSVVPSALQIHRNVELPYVDA